MDPMERGNPLEIAILAAVDGRQAQIQSAMPGVIQSFNAEAMTCVVQPALKVSQTAPDGSTSTASMPLLLDCPVHFPSGGGATLTFPIAQGDECLVVFASRCIDAWWQSGGIQPQAEFRMHDLSDGFVIPKVWSQPKVLTGISTTTAQLRSDDGETVIELDPVGKTVNITAPTGVQITSPVVSTTGNLVAGNGITTAFTTTTGQTVHVQNGIITNIY